MADAAELAMLAEPEVGIPLEAAKVTGKFVWSKKFIISLIIVVISCGLLIIGTIGSGVASESGAEDNVLIFVTSLGFSVLLLSLLMAGKFISDDTFGFLILSIFGIIGGFAMVGSGSSGLLDIPSRLGINILEPLVHL